VHFLYFTRQREKSDPGEADLHHCY
jgi:hypothetical protein